ncbi:hypothetical protein B0J13DRAFT_662901 [Dactylonectria estremocensis]|uniref:Uncharacterized protein n=1 Tax=Dactylonectria estremocensis TaxID=1079267 RepID=A0A9P9JAH2_9HYPO|nr:hypothetical protein B0J13DRAFT_662901 [Dactylonectria estremocensis]
MCGESIVLAICAPEKAPHMSFTCGKLHMVAGERIICDDAAGKCNCHFGTCGKVGRDITTAGTDLAELLKVRCASCTKREDNTGDRRDGKEIIDSPLLQRPAIPRDEETQRQHRATLKGLWEGNDTCPFHVIANTTGSSTEKADTVTTKNDASENEPAAPNNTKVTVTPDVKQTNNNVAPSTINNGLVTGVGLQSSHWANAPPAPPSMTRTVRSPRYQAHTPAPHAPITVRTPTTPRAPVARVSIGNFDAKARDATRKIFDAKSFLHNTS